MTTKHTVTDSRGQVHKRTSVERRYSHAIVTHYPYSPAHDYFRERQAYSRAEWASTEALANSAAHRHQRHGLEVEVIPATVIPEKEKAA